MPGISLQRLLEKNANGTDFRAYPANTVTERGVTHWERLANAFTQAGDQQMAQQCQRYSDSCRALVKDPRDAKEEGTYANAELENALFELGGMAEFLQHRQSPDGPTNYERILDQQRKLGQADGFNPDREQENFKQDLNTMNEIGELEIPLERLHEEADLNLHPEKKRALEEERRKQEEERLQREEAVVSHREKPEMELAADLFLDARVVRRERRKAAGTWREWEAADELDELGTTGQNTNYYGLNSYVEKLQAQKPASNAVVVLRGTANLILEDLEKCEDVHTSPEAQRAYLQKLSENVKEFLRRQKELAESAEQELAGAWKPMHKDRTKTYLKGIWNEKDPAVQDEFELDPEEGTYNLKDPTEKPFRLPEGVTYQQMATHLAAEFKERREHAFQLDVADGLSNLISKARQLSKENGEKRIDPKTPFLTLQQRASNLSVACQKLSDNYKSADDPETQRIMADAVQYAQEFTEYIQNFKTENPNLAEQFDAAFGHRLHQWSIHAFGMSGYLDPALSPKQPGNQEAEAEPEENLNININQINTGNEINTGSQVNNENIIDQQPQQAPVAPGPMSGWQLDMELHRQNVPQGKEAEYLARSMVGAVMMVEALPYTEKRARTLAEQLQKNKAFRSMARFPERVRLLARKSPDDLRSAAYHMANPFKASRERQIEVLRNLMQLSQHMDRPDGRTDKWQRLTKTIANLKEENLRNPKFNPEAKLQEIFDLTESYMKGKKRIRHSNDGKQRFNQALDVLGELGQVGSYAKDTCNALFFRTNEVRKKHNEETVSIANFGLHVAKDHENPGRQYGPKPAPQAKPEEQVQQGPMLNS